MVVQSRFYCVSCLVVLMASRQIQRYRTKLVLPCFSVVTLVVGSVVVDDVEALVEDTVNARVVGEVVVGKGVFVAGISRDWCKENN